jgi:hypothetical protein
MAIFVFSVPKLVENTTFGPWRVFLLNIHIGAQSKTYANLLKKTLSPNLSQISRVATIIYAYQNTHRDELFKILLERGL